MCLWINTLTTNWTIEIGYTTKIYSWISNQSKQVWNVSNNNQLYKKPPVFKLAYVQYMKQRAR